jgi:hypothetical protein
MEQVFLKLEPLMNIHIGLKEPLPIGRGPFGARFIGDISGGSFEGIRLRGAVLQSGGAWILYDPEGVRHVEARLVLETDDGAYIYVRFLGAASAREESPSPPANGKTEKPADYNFMTLHFETGSKRYQWMNWLMGVAEGSLSQKEVDYRVYEAIESSAEEVP